MRKEAKRVFSTVCVALIGTAIGYTYGEHDHKAQTCTETPTYVCDTTPSWPGTAPQGENVGR